MDTPVPENLFGKSTLQQSALRLVRSESVTEVSMFPFTCSFYSFKCNAQVSMFYFVARYALMYTLMDLPPLTHFLVAQLTNVETLPPCPQAELPDCRLVGVAVDRPVIFVV